MSVEPHAPAAEPVVVGVDGSPPSVRALAWTLRTAARQGWTVEIVTAWPDPSAVFVHDVPGHFSAPTSIGDSLALLVRCPVLVIGDDIPHDPVTARPRRLSTVAADRSRGDDDDEK